MNIGTKRIGNKKYYYLRHSYRKDNKIFVREKYLGEDIPKNIMKIKEDFIDKFKTELNKKLESIKDSFCAEWKKMPESAKKREIEEIAISFTYNTNAIEGSAITLEEVREIIQNKISPNKPIRDVREAEAHSKVFFEMINKKERITDEIILKWHKEIFGETKPDISGKYREYLVRIGNYIAPDWQEAPKMMKELIDFIDSNKKMNHVELSARVHYKFEKIHPFGDGNGRIGRLLMNYILWHNGYPMIIIEYKKRKSYYKALQKPEDGFLNYFIRRYLSVNKKRIV